MIHVILMRSYRVYIALIPFFLILNLSAQDRSAQISGQLMNQNNEPIPYSTVALLDSDSVVRAGVVSDYNGEYLLQKINAGTYRIIIKNLEYETHVIPPFSLKESEIKRIPTVTLEMASIKIDEVVVTGKRELVEVHPDKMVFNVSSTVNASGSNGLELLGKAPGVMIDPDNNIILQGKSGVRIFINGRPSRLSGPDLATLLQSMQSDNIESIELITNPSAKYEAEGNGGIINIKLKNNINLGYNGNIISSYTKGSAPRMSNGATFNYGKNKIGFNLNVTHFDNVFQEGFIDTKLQSGYELNLNSLENMNRNGLNITSGLDYTFNEKHAISFTGAGVLTDGDYNLLSNTRIIEQQTPFTEELLVSKTLTNYVSQNFNYNLNYTWNMSESALISMDLSYGSFEKDNHIDQPNTYFEADGMTAIREVNNAFDPFTQIDLYSIKADIEKSFEKLKLSAGTKYYQVLTENEFLVSDVVGGESTVNVDKSNTFNYTEKVLAFYFVGDYQLSEKLKTSAGLRVENTASEGVLESTQETGNDIVIRNYTNYFLNMSMSYTHNKSEISLGYGNRITRPSYQDLNPFENKTSELVIWKGNPFLKPNYTTNYQITYAYNHSLVISNTFSITEGYFARLLEIVDETSTFIVPRNMRKTSTNGLSVSFPITISEWWDASAFLVYNHSTYSGEFDNATINIKTDIYNIRMQNNIILPGDITMNLSAVYNSPWIWRGSIVIDRNYGLDLGFKKDFFDEKLQVRLTGTDIFNTRSDFPYTGDYGGIDMRGIYKSDNQRFGFGLTYKFGNQKIKNSRKKGGLDAELNRISD